MLIVLVAALLLVAPAAAQERLAQRVLREFRIDSEALTAEAFVRSHRSAVEKMKRAQSTDNDKNNNNNDNDHDDKQRVSQTYPFVVQLNPLLCGAAAAAACHERLRSHAQLGEGRYEIVAEDLAVLSLPWETLQQLTSSPFPSPASSSSLSSLSSLFLSSSSSLSSPLVSEFLALSPELKMSTAVLAMRNVSDSKACLQAKHTVFSGKLSDMTLGREKHKQIMHKRSPASPRPFALRFVAHAPASQSAWERFASFLAALEEEFNSGAPEAQAVVREIVLDIDEKNGYHGARRRQALAHGTTVSAWNSNPHRLDRRGKQYFTQKRKGEEARAEKITGDIFITDCTAVYAIAERLALRPEVLSVSHQPPIRAANKYAQYTCDTGTVGVYSPIYAMRQTTSSPAEVIGLADTGIDMNNCFFHDDNVDVSYQSDLFTTVLNPQHRKIAQYIAYADGAEDSSGHGTHVAGSLAGDTLSSLESYDMNPGVKLAFFDMGIEGEEGLYAPLDINTGLFERLYPSGARIYSNSWGQSDNGYNSDSRNVDMFMWNHPDTLVLFAAGNDGEYGAYTVGAPATAKNTLAVGASMSDTASWYEMYGYYIEGDEDFYNKHSVAYFSSKGPTADGRLKPEILAPGYWVESALGLNTSTAPFCDVQYMAGTSMATPVTASFAANVRRYFVDGFYPSGQPKTSDGFTPSGALVKAMMVHSAQPMKYVAELGRYGYQVWRSLEGIYPSISQGYGRLNLNNTMNFKGAPLSTGAKVPLFDLFVVGAANPASDKHYFAFSEALIRHTFYVRTNQSNPGTLRVTMCYTDYPGSTYARNAMMNKLLLSVRVNDSSESYSPYKATEKTDNTQRVDVTTTAADTVYAITITANTLIKADQPYALVVTGAFSVLEDGEPEISVVTASEIADDDDSSSPSGSDGTIVIVIAVVVVVVVVAVIVGLVAFCVYAFCFKESQSQSASTTQSHAHAHANAHVASAPPPMATAVRMGELLAEDAVVVSDPVNVEIE